MSRVRSRAHATRAAPVTAPPPWTPEVAIDDALVAALVAEQLPDLAHLEARRVGHGWDNVVYRLGPDLALRLPHRAVGAALIDVELRWLAPLAPLLPLPVPAPLRAGAPSPGFPYAFTVHRWIPGRTGCALVWTAAEQARAAAPLGAFLAALHTAPVTADAARHGPRDRFAKAALARHLPLFTERVAASGDLFSAADQAAARDLAGELAETPFHAGPPAWAHGDLYGRHLVVAEDGAPSGVIDWGDLHLGDPALDLSVAWQLFDPPARARLFAAYVGGGGSLGDPALARARFRALFYGVTLSWYGHEVGDAPIARLGAAALARALAG